MNIRQSSWMVGALASALALGCASDQSSARTAGDQTFSEVRDEELASERREFIQDREEQLGELDTQISRLEARLEHEAQYVDAEKKAEWSQELFELRQQHRAARAELQRAENASPEEWAEMRGTFDYSIDTLQAGVTEMGNEIGQLFGGSETTEVRGVDELGVDLCEMAEEGVSATLVEQGDELAVRFTTSDSDALNNLREEARDLSREVTSSIASDSREVAPGGRETGDQASTSSERRAAAGDRASMIDGVRVDNIDGGVSLIFEPARGQRDALRQQLEAQVDRVQNQNCD